MKSIAFVTESKSFDSLVGQFRRSGVNCLKLRSKSNLSEFEVIILDLAYPSEEAYPLLNQLRTESRFSEQIVLAAISDKTQIKKLRSIALGCDAYISPKIEYRDLLAKIKSLQDPDNFQVRVPFNKIPLKVEFEASITHISETGCLLHSRVGLSSKLKDFQLIDRGNKDQDSMDQGSADQKSKQVQIRSSLLKNLGVSSQHLMLENRALALAHRFFQSEIIFEDLSEESREKIRRVIHGWRI